MRHGDVAWHWTFADRLRRMRCCLYWSFWSGNRYHIDNSPKSFSLSRDLWCHWTRTSSDEDSYRTTNCTVHHRWYSFWKLNTIRWRESPCFFTRSLFSCILSCTDKLASDWLVHTTTKFHHTPYSSLHSNKDEQWLKIVLNLLLSLSTYGNAKDVHHHPTGIDSFHRTVQSRKYTTAVDLPVQAAVQHIDSHACTCNLYARTMRESSPDDRFGNAVRLTRQRNRHGHYERTTWSLFERVQTNTDSQT